MEKPRRVALTWARKLFEGGKSRAEMDTAIERSRTDKDPRAHAVRYLWTTGREFVKSLIKEGKTYEEVKTEIEGAEDSELASVRLACLEEIKREGHLTPQPTGCDAGDYCGPLLPEDDSSVRRLLGSL